MSLDDRLRNGLSSLVDDVRDPGASAERVLASSRMRRRRRRTFGVAGALLLGLGGAVLAADRSSDDPPTEVAGVTVTAAPTTLPGDATPTTIATAEVPATAAPVVTTAPSAPAPTTVAAAGGDLYACGVPLLPRALPDGFAARLSVNPLGIMELRASADRWITVAPSLTAPVANAGARSLELSGLTTRAVVNPAVDGVTLAEFALPASPGCAPFARLFTKGLTAAETDRVLVGLVPQSACSASGAPIPAAAEPADLPAAVADTWAKVRAAAASCDFVGLSKLSWATTSFAGDVADVRREDQWRVDEGAGRAVLRTVAALAQAAPRRVESGITAGSTSYVWPASAGDPAAPLGPAGMDASTLFVEIRADGALVALRSR